MRKFNLMNIILCFIGLFASLAAAPSVNQDTIPVNYQLMDRKTFERLVVGNTVVGVTSNSKSLYLLYFAKDGVSEMWKQDKVYAGTWWIEKDELGRDFMRAIWPEYSSSQKQSKFSSSSQSGDATAAWYYVDPKQADTLLVATETYRTPVLLLPGRSFPAPQ